MMIMKRREARSEKDEAKPVSISSRLLRVYSIYIGRLYAKPFPHSLTHTWVFDSEPLFFNMNLILRNDPMAR